jgi:hypothetical protein
MCVPNAIHDLLGHLQTEFDSACKKYAESILERLVSHWHGTEAFDTTVFHLF